MIESIYIDTSVIGGCFDKEFDQASLALFELIKQGKYLCVYSNVTLEELKGAPQKVKDILDNLNPNFKQKVMVDNECRFLADCYLENGVLPPKSYTDALHLACATIVEADYIISWNFKHIVNYRRIKLVNTLNRQLNYQPIQIFSPPQIIQL